MALKPPRRRAGLKRWTTRVRDDSTRDEIVDQRSRCCGEKLCQRNASQLVVVYLERGHDPSVVLYKPAGPAIAWAR